MSSFGHLVNAVLKEQFTLKFKEFIYFLIIHFIKLKNTRYARWKFVHMTCSNILYSIFNIVWNWCYTSFILIVLKHNTTKTKILNTKSIFSNWDKKTEINKIKKYYNY